MSEQRLSARILDAFAGLDQEGFDWESCRPLADEVADLEAKLEVMERGWRQTLMIDKELSLMEAEQWIKTWLNSLAAAQQEGR